MVGIAHGNIFSYSLYIIMMVYPFYFRIPCGLLDMFFSRLDGLMVSLISLDFVQEWRSFLLSNC